MIEINNVVKCFEDYTAVNHLSMNIKEGLVYGLLGTNGAGKSTLLRLISGVTKADGGEIYIDGQACYDNPLAKEKIFYISDELYFFNHASVAEMQKYYSVLYPRFDKQQFYSCLDTFELDSKRKISTFSKGMKKQLAILFGVCAKTQYLLCDETFDGLDPVMRQAIKSLFIKEMDLRSFTPIIASHNLRELEDICDTVGLLHKGGILFSKEVDDLKVNLQKLQCLFHTEEEARKVCELVEVIKYEKRGSLYLYTVRGKREDIIAKINTLDVAFCEALPLSLEEIFICETEVVGYDIKKLILEG